MVSRCGWKWDVAPIQSNFNGKQMWNDHWNWGCPMFYSCRWCITSWLMKCFGETKSKWCFLGGPFGKSKGSNMSAMESHQVQMMFHDLMILLWKMRDCWPCYGRAKEPLGPDSKRRCPAQVSSSCQISWRSFRVTTWPFLTWPQVGCKLQTTDCERLSHPQVCISYRTAWTLRLP